MLLFAVEGLPFKKAVTPALTQTSKSSAMSVGVTVISAIVGFLTKNYGHTARSAGINGFSLRGDLSIAGFDLLGGIFLFSCLGSLYGHLP
jgi:hypothetical protein